MNLGRNLRKVVDVFVELDDDAVAEAPEPHTEYLHVSPDHPLDAPMSSEPAPNPPEPTQQAAPASTPEPAVPAAAAPAPSPAPGEPLDFGAVYKRAGIAPVPLTAEQLLETLAALPADLSADVRRATVNALLRTLGKASGATPQMAMTDARLKIAALTKYAQDLSNETEQFVEQANIEIRALEVHIQEKRNAIAEAQARLSSSTGLCSNGCNDLQKVLDFFGTDPG